MYKIESRFIKTPCSKLIRVSADFTNGDPNIFDQVKGQDFTEAAVRLDYRVFQDEAGKIDKEKIQETFMAAGAKSVDLRLIRVPRVTVRSEAVLRVQGLPEKLQAMAEIRGEQVPAGVIVKADRLESLPGEDVVRMVTV